MSSTIEQHDYKYIVPTGIALENEVENAETFRASVMKVWPERPLDPSRSQWMKLTENTESYSFWNHPEEDIYTEKDGQPV